MNFHYHLIPPLSLVMCWNEFYEENEMIEIGQAWLSRQPKAFSTKITLIFIPLPSFIATYQMGHKFISISSFQYHSTNRMMLQFHQVFCCFIHLSTRSYFIDISILLCRMQPNSSRPHDDPHCREQPYASDPHTLNASQPPGQHMFNKN